LSSNPPPERETKQATARTVLVLVNEVQEMMRGASRVQRIVYALAERHGIPVPPEENEAA
jgi:hypothetical protein